MTQLDDIGFEPETITAPKLRIEPIEEDLGFEPAPVTADDRENNLQAEKATKKQQERLAFLQQRIAEADANDPRKWTLDQTQKYFRDNPAKNVGDEGFRKNILDTKRREVKSAADQIQQMEDAERLRQHVQPGFYEDIGLSRQATTKEKARMQASLKKREWDLLPPTAKGEWIMQRVSEKALPFMITAPAAGVIWPWMMGFEALNASKNVAVPLIKGEGAAGITALEDRHMTELLDPVLESIPEKGDKIPDMPEAVRVLNPAGGVMYDAAKWAAENPRKAFSVGASMGELMLDYMIVQRGMNVAADIKAVGDPRLANAFKTLGLSPNATTKEAEAAFRNAALRLHPDRGGSAELFDRATQAIETVRSYRGNLIRRVVDYFKGETPPVRSPVAMLSSKKGTADLVPEGGLPINPPELKKEAIPAITAHADVIKKLDEDVLKIQQHLDEQKKELEWEMDPIEAKKVIAESPGGQRLDQLEAQRGIVKANAKIPVESETVYQSDPVNIQDLDTKVSQQLVKENQGRDLTPDEQFAQNYIRENPQEFVKQYLDRIHKEYRAPTDNIVSADSAKFAIPGMSSDKSKSYHETGSAFAKFWFEHLLSDPSTKDLGVVFTAGGSGAGKSHVVRAVLGDGYGDFAAIYDTNLGNKKSFEDKLRLIEEYNKKLGGTRLARIIYVDRDPVEAWTEGVMPRAVKQDRIVPEDAHVNNYLSREVAKEIHAGGETPVLVIRNDHNTLSLSSLDTPTQTSYTPDELKKAIRAETEKAYADGKINKSIYDTAKGVLEKPTPAKPPSDPGRSLSPGSSGSAGERQQDRSIRSDERAQQEWDAAETDLIKRAEMLSSAEIPPAEQAQLDLKLDNLLKTPEGNLFVAIKKLGGIKTHAGGALREEIRDLPLHLRNNSGLPADEMASALSSFGWRFETENDLIKAIQHQIRNPIQKADRANLKAIIKQSTQNPGAQQKIAEAMGKQRKFITTVKESPNTAAELAKTVEGRYDPIANETTLEEAKGIVSGSPERAREIANSITVPLNELRVSNTVSILMIREAQAAGNWEDAKRWVEIAAERNTQAGQGVQALAMYNALTPEGILQFASKIVREAQRKGGKPQSLEYFFKKVKDLEGDEQKKALAKKLGIPYLSNKDAAEIKALADKLQSIPDWEPPQYTPTKGARTPEMFPGQVGVPGENVPHGPGVQAGIKGMGGVTTMSRERQIATLQLINKINSLIPIPAGRKISAVQTMAMLLNPKTIIRNIFGNLGFLSAENLADTVGIPLDWMLSFGTGERTQFLPSAGAQARGIIQGAKEAHEEIQAGVDLKQFLGGKSVEGKWAIPTNGVFDKGVLGALEKTLRYVLMLPDRAFYQAAFNQSLLNQARALKTDEYTLEMIEQAHLDGLVRTFQDTNVISKAFSDMKRILNRLGTGNFGMGDMVLKFPFTPSNILKAGIEYSPAGTLKVAKTLYDSIRARKFQQKAFVRTTSRTIVGSALTVGAGALLARLGIITGRPDKDKDVATAQATAGVRGYQVNFSALKRFLMSGMNAEVASWRDGDTLVSYDWAQPMAMPIALGANIYLDSQKPTVGKVWDMVDQLTQSTQTLVDQPLLQGLQRLASSPTKNILEGFMTAGQAAPASFIPTLLYQVRQLTDNIARNTRDPDYFRGALYQAANRIPGVAGKIVPERVTPLGEPKEMYQMGGNNPFNVFLNPAFVNKYQPDPVSRMVLDIWQNTGNTEQFPRVAQWKIRVGDVQKELNSQEYHDYQIYIGQKTNALFRILKDMPEFMGMADDEKAKLLSGYLTDINTAAKIELFGYQPKKISDNVAAVITDIKASADEARKNIKKSDVGFIEEDLGFVPGK